MDSAQPVPARGRRWRGALNRRAARPCGPRLSRARQPLSRRVRRTDGKLEQRSPGVERRATGRCAATESPHVLSGKWAFRLGRERTLRYRRAARSRTSAVSAVSIFRVDSVSASSRSNSRPDRRHRCATLIWKSSSHAEPIAICRNARNCGSVDLPHPSLTLDPIETAARCICETSPMGRPAPCRRVARWHSSARSSAASTTRSFRGSRMRKIVLAASCAHHRLTHDPRASAVA